MFEERTEILGGADGLVATFCEPTDDPGAASRPCVLLTNAGVIPRIGAHRMNVRLARALAARGFRSVRFDLHGFGDSPRLESASDRPELQPLRDVSAVMDAVQDAGGTGRFVAVGFCSGADVGFYSAYLDDRIVGAVLFDTYVFSTRKTQVYRLIRKVQARGPIAVLRRGVAVGTHFLRGGRKAAGEAGQSPAAYGRFGGPTLAEFAAAIQQLLGRGMRLLFVYSGGDLDSYNYEGQFADVFGRWDIPGRVDYLYLPDVDHSVTQPKAQQRVVQIVLDWVGQVFEDRGGPVRAAAKVSSGS